jgi:hypothetical protein
VTTIRPVAHEERDALRFRAAPFAQGSALFPDAPHSPGAPYAASIFTRSSMAAIALALSTCRAYCSRGTMA